MIVSIDHFDIKSIAESGQCFRFKQESRDTWSFVAFGQKVTVKQLDDSIDVSCSKEEWEETFAPYFDATTDYSLVEKIVRDFNDEHLLLSYNKGRGIRILRQDLWEVIISFLISQNNNIPRIKSIIEKLCSEAGVPAKGKPGIYAFPNPFDLSEDFFDTHELGLGYRKDYLKEMYSFARKNPDWLSFLQTLSYEDARRELLLRKGIGPKVADCICLFGLHHIDAFPVDTHVKELLNKYYSGSLDVSRFNGYAGIIQQYLFYYEIT